MQVSNRLTDRLDYLQRSFFDPESLQPDAPATSAPTDRLRRLLLVKGIGRLEKARRPDAPEPKRLITEDVLVGLSGYKVPLAFVVQSTRDGVAIRIGTWSSAEHENAGAAVLDARQGVLTSVLEGLYPAVDLEPDQQPAATWQHAGLVLGIPTARPPDPQDPALPLDRLIRALAGSDWAFVVLAEPVDEAVAVDVRNSLINEVRSAQSAAKAESAPSPLTDYYTSLIDAGLKALTDGLAVGAWRTGVYLLGDPSSYYRLASVWRSVFSGERSLPEPVRVWDAPLAADLATRWALPDVDAPAGPGFFHHPFLFQTLLTSSQLAAHVHLPEIETSGFRITVVPRFDAEPPATRDDETVAVGPVVQATRTLSNEYRVRARTLTRHAFVAGVTGSGKTNTIFHLLAQVGRLGVPFLVVEPTKREYRALLNDPALADRLRVFTIGDETVSPFRVNPFEVVGWPQTSVGVHLDLLRSAFTASFGLWTPLPQVLEQALHKVYRDRGWDVVENTNPRLSDEADAASAFPTLSDLVDAVDEVVRNLGYDARVTSDIHAALRTRLNALRTGGKGRTFDVQRSLPIEMLLEQPTVVELESMGDDDDRAFAIGLLLLRLAEYRRAVGQRDGLEHLLVIEEAHRLLANVAPRQSEEQADPRGRAVETFSNLLSEIRAYGQGVVIADQVPVRLAPDVIKNSNLKIAHRVVAEDDRRVLAGAMAMDEAQALALATLRVGQAATFGDGDDAPVLVQVPLVKGLPDELPSDDVVRDRMAAWRSANGFEALFLPHPTYASIGITGGAADHAARALVEDVAVRSAFARLVASAVTETGAFDRLWEDVRTLVRARQVQKVDELDLLRCLAVRAADWFVARRGAQAGWSYRETEEIAHELAATLLDVIAGGRTEPLRLAFQRSFKDVYARSFVQCPSCERVWEQTAPICWYRYAADDLAVAGTFTASWNAADVADARDPERRRAQTWEVCLDAGYELVEFPEPDSPGEHRAALSEAARRASLCFAQQMLAHDDRKLPRTTRRIMEKLLAEARG